MSPYYNILSENSETTVVAHYESQPVVRETSYQGEEELEQEFIEQLERQGYEYVSIKEEYALIANLRAQLEKLNHFTFTDNEWERFFKTELAAEGKSIADKAQTIQKDHIKTLKLDDGTERNIYLLNKEDIHANSTQVINQYSVKTGSHPNRYDVTILINGLPLVHVELKRRGVSIKEAFNQINRYGRESFWAGCALFEYVQIFIISNGTETKYYSNTTRAGHISEINKQKNTSRPRTSNSFEFTSYWADGTNKVLNDLTDFTSTFLSRHTLLNVLTRFCVLTEQKLLMVMRPYQIAATEEVLRQIEKAHNSKTYGTKEAGGYVWHTTGSGKTLTSFKTAQLATKIDYIDKVLFVVDRKDLDYQTMKEYDRFQKGAANGNTSSKELQRQLESGKSKIIITTIQKLSNFIKKNPRHPVYGKDVVMIFDECHRSQFGEMHTAITKRFKRYYIFGFTGTPIFAENVTGGGGMLRTTEDVFGRRLHTYTIVDAIRDHNVLRFRMSYVSTMREKECIEDSKVWDIQRENALCSSQRIHNVTSYILEHFDQQTKRASSYTFTKLSNIEEVVKAQSKGKSVPEVHNKARLNGFNSIFAVQSIEFAKLYYNELKRQIAELPENKKLKIATIFSYAANDELQDGVEDENNDDTTSLSQSDRDFLEGAIADYNEQFATNYDTSSEKFPNYYKDVSQRMKNREIDILIVVNMFLTGFDATTLNTLWVDKNLRYHGLLQAFSRTNRILNSVKVAGNIVCFRNLEENTNKALALFGDREAHSTTILRPFEDYFYGFTDENGKKVKGYKESADDLMNQFTPGELPFGEKAEKEFIKLFGHVLRGQNFLSSFDEFAELNPLSERDFQDFTSTYITLADKYRNQTTQDKTDINDDIEFEMELVKQVEVNIDYILYLIAKYKEGHCQNLELRLSISRAIDSAPDLRDKKELIEEFVDNLTPDSSVDSEWKTYVNQKKRNEFTQLIENEHLKSDKAITFIENAFKRGYVPEGGIELNEIMPPLNPFDPSANRESKVKTVLDKIKAFFNKFYEIANGIFR